MIEVRTAEKSDIDAMRTLMVQLCEAQGVEFEEKRFDWGIKRRLFDRLQKHGLLIAEDKDQDKIAGMIYAELIIDPFGKAEGYIRQVIVEGGYRGSGIGTKLIENAVKYLKEMGAEVIRINATEKQLEYYSKFGFTKGYNVMEMNP